MHTCHQNLRLSTVQLKSGFYASWTDIVCSSTTQGHRNEQRLAAAYLYHNMSGDDSGTLRSVALQLQQLSEDPESQPIVAREEG